MSLGEKIRELLARKGWSASRLAGMVDVSPAAISRIMAGGDTSTAIGFRLARKLDVSPAWLFDDSVGMESLSEYEETSGLAGVSDRDLVLAVDARVSRAEVMYANALEELRRIPLSTKRRLVSRQDQVLRGVIAQAGYDGYVYFVLLYSLLKLQERIAQLDKELRRRPAPSPHPPPGSIDAANNQDVGVISSITRPIGLFLDDGFFRRMTKLLKALSPPEPATPEKPKPRSGDEGSVPSRPKRPMRRPRS